jgi:hypothetical protein
VTLETKTILPAPCYNVQQKSAESKRKGEYLERKNRIIELLKTVDADFICVQVGDETLIDLRIQLSGILVYRGNEKVF